MEESKPRGMMIRYVLVAVAFLVSHSSTQLDIQRKTSPQREPTANASGPPAIPPLNRALRAPPLIHYP